MGLLGHMTQATIHITNLDEGGRISLAWTPEKVSVSQGGRFQSYNIIETGEVKLPRGLDLKSVKWSGKFPGASRKDYAFIHAGYWEDPKTIIQILEDWREKRAKLRLLITQTGVNMDVYLDNFSYDWEGGHGDANYNIEFIAAKDMLVKTVQEVDAERAAAAASEQESPALGTRPSIGIPGTVLTTVSTGNCWGAAQAELGDGSRWPEVYALNEGKAGVTRDSIAAGTSLKLPV